MRRKPDPLQALQFLSDINRAGPWVLFAHDKRVRLRACARCSTAEQARAFILDHAPARTVSVLLASLKADAIPSDPKVLDLKHQQWAGLSFRENISARRKAAEAWHRPPHLWLSGPDRGIALWQFLLPEYTHPSTVEAHLKDFAERMGGTPIQIMVPIPEIGTGWSYPYLRKHSGIAPIDWNPPYVPSAKPKRKRDGGRGFTRGDKAEFKKVPALKEDWIPFDALTLDVGRPKQGKSLSIAKFAAYITAGGSYEMIDGKPQWRDGWFDGTPVLPESRGSVIIQEREDSVAETLARCMAAGADLKKVHARKFVADISNPTDLKELTALAEELGDCRLISFSPILGAVRSKDKNPDIIQQKLDPLLEWADGRNIALIGILHLDKEGKGLAGSDVLLQACRSVIEFGGGAMTIRDSNIGATGTSARFVVEKITRHVNNEEIKTARMLFLPNGDLASETAASSMADTPPEDTDTPQRMEALLRTLFSVRPSIPGNDIRVEVERAGMTAGGTLHSVRRRLGIAIEETPGMARPNIWHWPMERRA